MKTYKVWAYKEGDEVLLDETHSYGYAVRYVMGRFAEDMHGWDLISIEDNNGQCYYEKTATTE